MDKNSVSRINDTVAATPLLSVKDLQGWYGESHVLHGITFDVW